ncbi:MAG: divalent-cation tolerance protein CutA [Candidatus Omnitrophica bacterium]|nr:divalent-cation tolerance protein CutA [Candidatus Omnitrophota bacterium]MBU1038185.1 divalent-cation tolerance protein CutA [Candidatus Omnitrophota bacterium]MBU1808610.1 divalent-cation tolerance protein CutA [Candidatus Omnitrophota bacterium]
MSNNYIVIFVTCPSKREADSIAGSLLKKRFVACANIINKVESKFWWNGKIDKACETLIVLKTAGNKFKAVEKEVRRLHSYEVPEIIAIPILALSEDYGRWIRDSVK